jgi:RND family efflux transporter MFP subunit
MSVSQPYARLKTRIKYKEVHLSMPHLSRNRIFFILITIVFSLIFTGCSKKEEAKQEVIRPAKIFTVGDSTGELTRTFPGEVEATDKAIQSFRVGGELIERPAQPGQAVKKGDVLAKLDPKDYQLKYDDSKAKYDLAKVQYERAGEIWEKRLIARADYDKAKTRFLAAKADLEQAKANLDYTVLRAPFDGVVSKVYIDNFANVHANDPVVNIQSLDTVDIVFQVPESVISRMKRGQGKLAVFKVKFTANGGEEFPAQLKEFNTEADPQTQTFRTVVTIDRPTTFTVLEGMSTTVEVDLSAVFAETTNKIVIPSTAVFAAEEQPVDIPKRFVWKVDPNTMQVSKQAVTVGQLTASGIEVTSGVEPGEKLIAAGVSFIHDGQKVKPWVRERGL